MKPGYWSQGWRAWVPALIWSLGIFVLSSIPGSAFPELPGWWHADKLVHLGIYATLGALCWYGAHGTLPIGRGAAAQVIVAFLVTALYGVTDEAHQAFTPLRSARSLRRPRRCGGRPLRRARVRRDCGTQA